MPLDRLDAPAMPRRARSARSRQQRPVHVETAGVDVGEQAHLRARTRTPGAVTSSSRNARCASPSTSATIGRRVLAFGPASTASTAGGSIIRSSSNSSLTWVAKRAACLAEQEV